jgi:twitching motility protein PilT
MTDLKKLLVEAARLGASDLHLKVGNYPFLRIDGELSALEGFERTSKDDTSALVQDLLSDRQQEVLANRSEVDLSFGVKGLGRFRLAVFRQRGTISMAFRIVPTLVPTLEELHLPSVLKEIADSLRGLVLVTGITGSGKSTTLASIVRYLNETRSCHILTIEDPIEFLFADEQAIISQREISSDTVDFGSALRAAMRQDPDVIMVGEMRDMETIRIALQAAQTGHLVLSTLHTTDARTTVDRVISLFPENQQRDIRIQFASALNATISLRLIRSSVLGARLPAVEILRNTELVYSLITDATRSKELKNAIENGKQYRMQSFDQSILEHHRNAVISAEDALKFASSPDDLRLKIGGIVGASELV